MMNFSQKPDVSPHFEPPADQAESTMPLAAVEKGGRATVVGFEPDIPVQRQTHLQAYGLAPGIEVKVLQQKPVAVIQVDHVELALENDLAGAIRVAP